MFTRLNPLAAPQFIDVTAGQLAVVGEAADNEIHVSPGLICMTALDESLDHLNHLGYVLGCPRLDIRRRDIEFIVCPPEGSVGHLHDLVGADSQLVRCVDDLVIDIGDVAHVGDLISKPLEIAAYHVEHNGVTTVPNVWVGLDCRTTDVHRDLARVARFEVLKSPSEGVEDAHGR